MNLEKTCAWFDIIFDTLMNDWWIRIYVVIQAIELFVLYTSFSNLNKPVK